MKGKKVMLKRSIIVSVFICSAVLFFYGRSSESDAARVPDIDINAKSAILMDAWTGKVLYEKDPDLCLQPASIVKMMTAMVALDKMSVDDEIIITNNVLYVEPTYIGVKPGEKYRLGDLITAILVKSGNDAAVAIADGVAGSEKKFVELMNNKAKQLGMDNTNFTSASGLPASPRESQYSTSRDMAALMTSAVKYPDIVKVLSETKGHIKSLSGRRLYYKTHNKSLYSDEGAAWGKTGYTRKARRTFIGMDPSDEPKIIFAIMKSNDLWKDIAEIKKKGLEEHKRRHDNVFDKIMRKILFKDRQYRVFRQHKDEHE